MIRSLFTLLCIALALNSKAQFTQAELGIDGLTCSACTRSVEMSLRKLDFVKDVKMNLDNTNGVITFKENSPISIEKIAKAVVDAGFSVRYLQATFKAGLTMPMLDNHCLVEGDVVYQFVHTDVAQLKDDLVFKFIGKEFLPAKEYRKWKDDLKPACKAKSTYYVTL
jgi:copper chaperone CopZ